MYSDLKKMGIKKAAFQPKEENAAYLVRWLHFPSLV